MPSRAMPASRVSPPTGLCLPPGLLPFNKQQVNSYLNLRKSELTYEQLTDKHLEDEEITKPLMLSMLVIAFPRIYKDLDRLSKNNLLNSNIARTLIYMNMFYELFLGKVIELEKRTPRQRKFSFYQEKKTLSTVSFFKQIKNDLTLEEIENWSSESPIHGKASIIGGTIRNLLIRYY
jgi:hypothetical protein